MTPTLFVVLASAGLATTPVSAPVSVRSMDAIPAAKQKLVSANAKPGNLGCFVALKSGKMTKAARKGSAKCNSASLAVAAAAPAASLLPAGAVAWVPIVTALGVTTWVAVDAAGKQVPVTNK